jgi:hypothetical protein
MESDNRKITLIQRNFNQFIVDQIFATLPLTYNKIGIDFRKRINPYLTKEFVKTLPHKIRVLKNEYENDGRPTIYSASHIFYDDIAAILCAISENMYLVADSDTKKDINPLEALALYLNGVMFFEKDPNLAKQNEREKLTNRMIKILDCGGKILIFPESTWNFSPNKLIRDDLPWGLLKVADAVNANVVPVAIDLVKDEYLVNVGKKISRTSDLTNDIRTLRDDMATLVWQLIELKEPLKREKLGLGIDENYCYDYIQDRLIPNEEYWYNYIKEKCQGGVYDFVKEERCAFRQKGKISLDEIIAEMFGMEYRSMASDYEAYIKVRNLSDGFARIKR